MENLRFESKRHWVWFAVILPFVPGFFVGFIQLWKMAFEHKYVDLGQIILSFIMLASSITSLVSLMYLFPKVKIIGQQLIVKNIFFTKIYDLDTLKCLEVVSKTDFQSGYTWEELVLYFPNMKRTFYSTCFRNFKDLKKSLVVVEKLGRPDQPINKYDRFFSLFLALIFVFFAAMIMNYCFNPDFIDKNNLRTVAATLQNIPKTENSGKRGSDRLEFRLNEYPDFVFQLSNIAYDAANISKFLHDIKGNDSVQVAVFLDDFDRKLTLTVPLTFLDKHFFYETIEVYGLSIGDNPYLIVENYNAVLKKDVESNRWWMLLAALLMFGLAFYIVRFYLKKE